MVAVALHCVWYNFVRVHQTLRVTPAAANLKLDHYPEPVCLIARVPE
jgi:hypothetical protein